MNFQHTRITILGYGSQGRAQALNLKDSGCDVVVGLRPQSPSFKKAKKDRVQVLPIDQAIDQALERAQVICFLVPDECQADLYRKSVEPKLKYRVKKNITLLFAHGFSVFFKLIKPPSFVDTVLVAPKISGGQLRTSYLKGENVTACMAIHHNASGKAQNLTRMYSQAIGCGHILKTTFKEETIANLFGEQTVKCGGVLDLMKASFETLVKDGISREIASVECIQGMKYMIDLVEERGFKGLQQSISPIAYYGGISRGRRLVNETQKRELKNILKEIKSGQFAKEWLSRNSY